MLSPVSFLPGKIFRGNFNFVQLFFHGEFVGWFAGYCFVSFRRMNSEYVDCCLNRYLLLFLFR